MLAVHDIHSGLTTSTASPKKFYLSTGCLVKVVQENFTLIVKTIELKIKVSSLGTRFAGLGLVHNTMHTGKNPALLFWTDALSF